MTSHQHDAIELTKNQKLVHEVLVSSNTSLSAYGILDTLRDSGFRAPLQVYRALDKLVEFGMVHRLESLNAFVACSHPDCISHQTMAFMICESCESVSEISNDKLFEQVGALAKHENFKLKQTTVELIGKCQACDV